jgi:cyclopropane-fatty-acyl-phospholipid synthase
MIYQFETQAGGRITYTSVVGARLLHLIGKQPGPRGVITVGEIPAAILALEAAVQREKEMTTEQRQELEPHADESRRSDPRDDEREREPAVSLGQRAFPFIDLLKHALSVKVDVTWGI